MSLNFRHQQWRYLFQTLWLLIVGTLLLAGADWRAWLGLLLAALVSTLLVKRAACSFACPLFAAGELLWRTGEKLFGRTFAPPFWLDLLLRSAKYLLLAAILWGQLGATSGAVPLPVVILPAAALPFLSLFFQMRWCRYLCPAGALLGLGALASLLRIRRSTRRCVRCHKCSQRCPAHLPVMLLTRVRSSECFACYRCIDGCPAPGALALAAPGERAVPAWLAGILVGTILLAGLWVGLYL